MDCVHIIFFKSYCYYLKYYINHMAGDTIEEKKIIWTTLIVFFLFFKNIIVITVNTISTKSYMVRVRIETKEIIWTTWIVLYYWLKILLSLPIWSNRKKELKSCNFTRYLMVFTFFLLNLIVTILKKITS